MQYDYTSIMKTYYSATYVVNSRLTGVMISVLVIGPKVCWFKPGRGNGFSRAIKTRSKHSFGEEVKLSAPCRRTLWHVNTSKYDRDTSAKFKDISLQLSASLLYVSAVTREHWWMHQE
jgi:hypothetical protein